MSPDQHLYQNVITGQPALAWQWGGKDDDVTEITQLLAAHTDGGQHLVVTDGREHHQMLPARTLLVTVHDDDRLHVFAKWWIVITGIDLPRPDRKVVSFHPGMFTTTYRRPVVNP